MLNVPNFKKSKTMKTKKSEKANLEKKRWLFFQIGLILSLALVLAAFEWGSTGSKKAFNEFAQTRVDEDLIEITMHKEKEPEIPKPKPNPVIDVVDDLDEQDDADINVEVTDETLNNPDFRIDEIIEIEPEDDAIYSFVQVYPQFPGGEAAMRSFISSNLVYTRMAREINLQGTVYVSFVVYKDGSISDIQILRGLGAGLDEEVIRVVSEMPDWIPGNQNGKTVNVRFAMPVQFKLN
jgi:periplasmic protein TonB